MCHVKVQEKAIKGCDGSAYNTIDYDLKNLV